MAAEDKKQRFCKCPSSCPASKFPKLDTSDEAERNQHQILKSLEISVVIRITSIISEEGVLFHSDGGKRLTFSLGIKNVW